MIYPFVGRAFVWWDSYVLVDPENFVFYVCFLFWYFFEFIYFYVFMKSCFRKVIYLFKTIFIKFFLPPSYSFSLIVLLAHLNRWLKVACCRVTNVKMTRNSCFTTLWFFRILVTVLLSENGGKNKIIIIFHKYLYWTGLNKLQLKIKLIKTDWRFHFKQLGDDNIKKVSETFKVSITVWPQSNENLVLYKGKFLI